MRRLRELLEEGCKEGVFPGAVALVADKGRVIFLEAVGLSSFHPVRLLMKEATIFDLASLTKPLATTLAVMKLVDAGQLTLDEPLAGILRNADLRGKGGLTPRLLLCHSAGLPDWRPYHLKLALSPPEVRKGLLRRLIIEEPFVYEPGKGWLYGDLGFMLLEWVIEERAGQGLPQHLEEHFYGPLGLKKTFMCDLSGPLRYPEEEFAATEDCPWRKRILRGEVHDENAFALGGHSGHAGLFGAAEEVFAIAGLLREHFLGKREDFLHPETVRMFFARQYLGEGSTRALGWDTPSPEDSSAGRYFSPTAVGHLGFTGTSLWMDLDHDVIAVLLTNRVHPTRTNEKIKLFRPRFHDRVMEELEIPVSP